MASEKITLLSQVMACHKIAARMIESGAPIIKYNVCVGYASADIPAGNRVHYHDSVLRDTALDYAHDRDYQPSDILPDAQQATFQGIVCANGEVASRSGELELGDHEFIPWNIGIVT